MVRIHLWNLPDDITPLRARHLREVVEHAPDIDTLRCPWAPVQLGQQVDESIWIDRSSVLWVPRVNPVSDELLPVALDTGHRGPLVHGLIGELAVVDEDDLVSVPAVECEDVLQHPEELEILHLDRELLLYFPFYRLSGCLTELDSPSDRNPEALLFRGIECVDRKDSIPATEHTDCLDAQVSGERVCHRDDRSGGRLGAPLEIAQITLIPDGNAQIGQPHLSTHIEWATPLWIAVGTFRSLWTR